MKYFSLLLFILIGYSSYSQEKFHVINIENDSVFEDLAILDSTDNSYRLFFSGENHLFQESNLKLELKLFKYFHQKHDANTLLLEFGDITGWMVSEYVQSGDKKLEKAIEKHFGKNFFSYFKEIKKYNDSLKEGDKIKIEGIDIQRSLPIGFEMIHHLLPEDSIRPDDSILQQIELIKFLRGYNKNKNSWGNENVVYFNGSSRNQYSNLKSMKLVFNNFKKFQNEYKVYFGENFDLLKRFISSIKKSITYFDMKKTGTPIGILYREEHMYTELNKIAKYRPNDKFYGQFGRNHTLRNINSNGYTYNFSSVVAKIDKNRQSVLNKKVFSAGIYYLNSRDNYSNYNATNYTVKNYILDNLSFPKDSIAILKVKKDSELDSILEHNYDYIIVHNARYKNEQYIRNDWNYDETISFNFIYGQYMADLGGTYNYLGLSEAIRPISYWGVTYSNLFDGFYFDYQFLSFIKSKHTISDTSKAEFRGYNISINVGYDILKTRRFDLIPMVGFGYQQTNLKITSDNTTSLFSGINSTEINLKNPSLYFDFSGEFRIMLAKDFLGLSIKSGYRLDVSDSRWKFNQSKLDDAKFNQSGLFFQAGICLGSF